MATKRQPPVDQNELDMHQLVRLDPVDLDFDSVEIAENFIRAGLLAIAGEQSWLEVQEISKGDPCSRTVFYLDRSVSGGSSKPVDLLVKLPAEFIDRLGSHCYDLADDLTWQCDSGSCEHETDVRHERQAGVFCEECSKQRIKNSFDPEAEAAEQESVRAQQRKTVDQSAD